MAATAAPSLQPLRLQRYIHFGACKAERQLQQYGNWLMTRPLSKQSSASSLVLHLHTGNTSHVAAAFGQVDPSVFPLEHIYFGYQDLSGVAAWSPALAKTPYKETTSWYTLRVNGKYLYTNKDLKDQGSYGPPLASIASLKGTLRGLMKPSTTPYRIEIVKSCMLKTTRCKGLDVPNPASVSLTPEGYVVYSLWSVKQPLTINGTYVKDHGWCPVQTAVTVD